MRRPTPIAALALLLAAGCSSATPPAAEDILARHDLTGSDAVEIIDRLDRLGGADRPTELMASVRPDELVLSDEGGELTLDLPEDRFYLSLAPYVERTHECVNHSLTTCQGELAAEEVQVTVIEDETGDVLVDESLTTFDNGFVGLWLPADVRGTVHVAYDGKSGEVAFATGDDDPTCLTTLQLS